MSIAVNVRITPSLSMPFIKAGALSALACSLVWMLPVDSSETFRGTLAGVFALFFLALSLYRDVKKADKTTTVRISPSGFFYIVDDVPRDDEKNSRAPNTFTEAMQLQPNSTIWPFLLLLILKNTQGATLVISIMQDDMPRNDFRRLQVACRWIARHNDPAQNVTN